MTQNKKKQVTLTFDESILLMLNEYCKHNKILSDLWYRDNKMQHDCEYGELLRKLIDYTNDKIGGMLAYNYLTIHNSGSVSK